METSESNAASETVLCKKCKKEIPGGADKCYLCGTTQTFSWFWFLHSLSSTTAFILVIISAVSLFQTCSEKKNAELSAEQARQAKQEATKSRVIAERAMHQSILESEVLVDNLKIEVDRELHKLSQLSDFQSNLLRIQNDERKAYVQLQEWAKDTSFPFKTEAARHYIKITEDASVVDETKTIRQLSAEQIGGLFTDKEKRSLEELIGKYRNIKYSQSPTFNYIYITYIVDKRADFPKQERLSFLVSIIKDDPSLGASRFAGWRFAKLTKYQGNWLNKEAILRFWEKNKENYK